MGGHLFDGYHDSDAVTFNLEGKTRLDCIYQMSVSWDIERKPAGKFKNLVKQVQDLQRWRKRDGRSRKAEEILVTNQENGIPETAAQGSCRY